MAGLAGSAAALALAGAGQPVHRAGAAAACTPGTPAQTEGPYYTPSTPLRSDLREPGAEGEPLILEGRVQLPDCRPAAGAVIDLWHCDARGRYDNRGFRYRGHQFADAAGAFRFATVRPGRYPGRTPHFHVKVGGGAARLLTTQLYFPDRRDANAGDFIYRDELLMALRRRGGVWYCRFDFVLAPA